MNAKNNPNKKLSLAVLEDNENMLIGLRFQFEQSDIDICIASDDLDVFLQQVSEARPDVALIDLRMWQDEDAGLEVIKELRAQSPATSVVVYTGYATLENFHRAMALDIKGFVKKEHDVKPRISLIEIIRMVANGGEFYDSELFKRYKGMIGDTFVQENEFEVSKDIDLTDREMDVFRAMARNMSNQEIAGELVISIHTVKIHVQNIFKKLNVHTKRDALIIGKTRGII